jgi:membrane-associated phospholipid phosphatase
VSPPRTLALAAAAAYAALAGLVAAGSVTGLDQWAVDHLMPGAGRPGPAPTFLESTVPLLHADFGTPLRIVGQVVTLPGQAVVSLLLVAAGASVLRRRGRGSEAAAWALAWLLGSAVELACKHALARSPLHRDGLHAAGFDSSWPSGHAVRGTIVAAALAAAWPRARPLLAVWLLAALLLLEVDGFHTPSDILGGLLLAALLVAGAREPARSALLRGRAARRGGPRGARGRA